MLRQAVVRDAAPGIRIAAGFWLLAAGEVTL
jgi:hypothetical protein